MATHEILVPCQLPSGGIAKRGALLNYAGPHHWKFRPLDKDQRAEWLKKAADDERVREMIERSPDALCQPDEVPQVFEYGLLQSEGE